MNNIFSVVLERASSSKTGQPGLADRSISYAIFGFVLGLGAPIGWMLLRLLLFYNPEQELYYQTFGYFLGQSQQLALVAYMGAGTAIVLATFGFFIGRAAEQILLRAETLNQMNQQVATQKEAFERKYTELNSRIGNFHLISARAQKTMDLQELMVLTADSLHEIMEFDRVNILRVEYGEQQLRLITSLGSDKTPADMTLPFDARAGALYQAAINKRSYLVDDISLMPAEFKMHSPCDRIPALRSKSFLVCPVVVNDITELIVGVDNKTSGRNLEEDDIDTLKLFASQLSSSITRLRLFDTVETLTGELEHTFSQILQYRQDYQALLKTLKRATSSTIRLISEIANSADVVSDAVNSTQSASTEISASIDQVGNNISQLSEFMDKSISAMTQIAATIKEVDDNSVSSHQMSEQVRLQAAGGVTSVQATLAGLRDIDHGVAEAARTIDQLAVKGAEVGSITTVITEIAQKTNLLALNAAIIAAQAGDQGRSFAVVAEEIRGLSQKTAHSSAAISQLIRDMHKQNAQVVTQIRLAQDQVSQGVSLGNDTEQSLNQILASATAAMDMTRSIRHATREVSKSAEFVTKSIEELGEMTEQVSTASREQAHGTHGIVRSIEEVRSMSDDLAAIAVQQRQDSRDIEAAVESVADMAQRIFEEMDARSTQSRQVIRQLRQFREADGSEKAS